MAIVNYSYTDLAPLLDKAKSNSDYLWQQDINYEFNIKKIPTPKMPSQQRETISQKAERWNIYAGRKIKNIEKETDNIIAENQEILKQYREETDRRNNILNRMKQLRWIMQDRYNSDTKNRLAWTNMVRDAIKEYGQLREEANKFFKYIKR